MTSVWKFRDSAYRSHDLILRGATRDNRKYKQSDIKSGHILKFLYWPPNNNFAIVFHIVTTYRDTLYHISLSDTSVSGFQDIRLQSCAFYRSAEICWHVRWRKKWEKKKAIVECWSMRFNQTYWLLVLLNVQGL